METTAMTDDEPSASTSVKLTYQQTLIVDRDPEEDEEEHQQDEDCDDEGDEGDFDEDEDDGDADDGRDGPDMDLLERQISPVPTSDATVVAISSLQKTPAPTTTTTTTTTTGGGSANEPEQKITAEKLADSNKPKLLEDVEGLPSQIFLCVSPFLNRIPSVAFQAADRPITSDPASKKAGNIVIPAQVGNHQVGASAQPPPPQTGQRKRIGRKNKFGNLKFCLPDGAVRFSSVLSIFQMSGFGETENLSAPWSMRWTKRVEPEEYAEMKPHQRVNHFPGTWSIGRKDNLHKRLTSRQRRYGSEAYGFFPKGYLLPDDRNKLKDAMDLVKKKPINERKENEGLYILKPVASACGRGVRMLTGQKPPKRSQKGLVQEYVDDPLLIHGYKFDLRIYVVVTCYDPLRIYVYNDGLVRFASSPYPTALAGDTTTTTTTGNKEGGVESRTDRLMLKRKTAHLTNYSVNKKNTEEFVTPDDAKEAAAAEKASKWTLSSVRDYFHRQGLDWTGTWRRIEDIIIKTILCAEPDVASAVRRVFPATTQVVKNCFELYGFDVLLKRDLKPVLMEVNIMPSLSTKCSLLDQRVKANMIADMLTLAGGFSATRKQVKPKIGAAASVIRGSAAAGDLSASQRAAAGLDASNDHPFIQGLGNELQDMVMTTEEELERCMNFKRLFPTSNAYDTYKPLFAEHRTKNVILQEWEQLKEKLGVVRWSQYVTKERARRDYEDELRAERDESNKQNQQQQVPNPPSRDPAGGPSSSSSTMGSGFQASTRSSASRVRGNSMVMNRTRSGSGIRRTESATRAGGGNSTTGTGITGTFGAPPPVPKRKNSVVSTTITNAKVSSTTTTTPTKPSKTAGPTSPKGTGTPSRTGGGGASRSTTTPSTSNSSGSTMLSRFPATTGRTSSGTAGSSFTHRQPQLLTTGVDDPYDQSYGNDNEGGVAFGWGDDEIGIDDEEEEEEEE